MIAGIQPVLALLVLLVSDCLLGIWWYTPKFRCGHNLSLGFYLRLVKTPANNTAMSGLGLKEVGAATVFYFSLAATMGQR